jgi:hypothetical protein
LAKFTFISHINENIVNATNILNLLSSTPHRKVHERLFSGMFEEKGERLLPSVAPECALTLQIIAKVSRFSAAIGISPHMP